MQLVRRLLGTSPVAADLGLLVMRLWLGGVMFVAHGVGKWGKLDSFAAGLEARGYPIPEVMAVLAALAESVGSLFVALGLLTRPAALTLLTTMLVAALVQHAPDPWGKKELPLTFAVMALALVVAGAGRFSLDHLLHRRLQRGVAAATEPPPER
ncbi:MAG: DoxX family protein [Deltaproteobacteria bacterium]|nr:DoxX family protein [Deltaproteobacteria bacterium]